MCPSAANDAERFYKLRLPSEVTETLTWETPSEVTKMEAYLYTETCHDL